MPCLARIEPCEVLRRDGLASVLWLEDAIANYNVPTVVFQLHLLVSNPNDAAKSLRLAGWTDVETNAQIGLFGINFHHIQCIYLDPPTMEEEHETTPGLPPPVRKGPPPATRTVLLSAQDCNAPIEPLLSGNPPQCDTIPPLWFLVDGLISGVLDAPAESRLEKRLALQLVYLYSHCNEMRSPKLIEQLRLENRQFHIDALTGPSVGKAPLIAWNRRIRRQLQDGTRQLMYENSLLSTNPPEYQNFISQLHSDFRELQPYTLLSSKD